MSVGIALFCCLAKPSSCLFVILSDIFSSQIYESDKPFGYSVTSGCLRQQSRVNAIGLSLRLGLERRREQESRDGCDQCRCKDKRTDELLPVSFHSASRNRNKNSTASPFLLLFGEEIFSRRDGDPAHASSAVTFASSLASDVAAAVAAIASR